MDDDDDLVPLLEEIEALEAQLENIGKPPPPAQRAVVRYEVPRTPGLVGSRSGFGQSDSPYDSALAPAIERLAASFNRLAATQSAQRSIILGPSGEPVGVEINPSDIPQED